MLGFGCFASEPPAAANEAQQRVVAFCREYLERACAREVECTGTSAPDVCHPAQQEARCVALGAAAAVGRVQFVQPEATACLGALTGACASRPLLSFLVPVNEDRICPQALVGTAASGEGCHFWEECTAGTYCSARRPYRTSKCPGTCVAYTPSAMTEVSDPQCAPGQRLSAGRHSHASCLPPYREGEQCSFQLEPNGTCERGLFCRRISNTTGESRCERLGGEGVACTQASECAEGLTCAGPQEARTCRPVQALGAACTAGWNMCSRGFGVACVEGRCAWPRVGEACGLLASGERAGCTEGFCDAPPGHGAPPHGPGVCRAWTSGSQDGHSCGPSLRWTPATGECLGACVPPA